MAQDLIYLARKRKVTVEAGNEALLLGYCDVAKNLTEI